MARIGYLKKRILVLICLRRIGDSFKHSYHDFAGHVQGAAMKISKLEVLDEQEIKTIHRHSLEILEQVGIQVDLKKMRHLLADLGCDVDEKKKRVRFTPDFVSEYVKKAPREFEEPLSIHEILLILT